MKALAQRILVSSLALVMLLGPVLTVTAEAGPKHRRGERRVESRSKHRVERRVENRHDRRHHHRRAAVIRRDVRRHHHHRDRGVVPFLGGVAIGAIIGSQRSCPAPPPRHRAYVYDCGFCDGDYRDYVVYIDHLVIVHHVNRCDIERYYPMYEGGYWEEY